MIELEVNEPDSAFQITFNETSYNINSVLTNDLGLDEQTGYFNSIFTFITSSGDIDVKLSVSLFSAQEVNADSFS